jgi:toxin ParE1/3/4
MAWTVRLGHQAEQDFVKILRWTAENFGPKQAQLYAQTLSQAIQALQDGPDVLGAKPRHDIASGLHTLHVARQKRKGRHFVVFKATAEHCIDVLRVLHDSMDMAWHLGSGE